MYDLITIYSFRFPTALLVGTGNILSQVVQWKHLESLTLSWIPAMRSSVGLVNVAQVGLLSL